MVVVCPPVIARLPTSPVAAPAAFTSTALTAATVTVTPVAHPKAMVAHPNLYISLIPRHYIRNWRGSLTRGVMPAPADLWVDGGMNEDIRGMVYLSAIFV